LPRDNPVNGGCTHGPAVGNTYRW